jgi:hypothetical protein
MTEIENAEVLSHTAGAPLAPIAVTVAQAGTEELEGVLVTVTDITKVDIPYDCAVDSAPCTDARLWEINDAILVWNNVYGGTTTEWDAEGTGLAAGEPLTGVTFFRHNRRRIMPRTAADIGN